MTLTLEYVKHNRFEAVSDRLRDTMAEVAEKKKQSASAAKAFHVVKERR